MYTFSMSEEIQAELKEFRSPENQKGLIKLLREDRLAAMQLKADITEAIKLVASDTDQDRERLAKEVLPDLSERLGEQPNDGQSIRGWLDSWLEDQVEEIRRIDSQLGSN